MRNKDKMKQVFTLLIFGLLFNACSVDKDRILERVIDDYYKTYNKRQDIDKFMSFYNDDILFEDIINGDRIEGKPALKSFFNWGDTNFKSLDSNNLVITETIIDGKRAVVKGYFTKFKWGESDFEPMHFTTILTFGSADKIIKQVDWVNYPANLVDYNQRKNSNEWVK